MDNSDLSIVKDGSSFLITGGGPDSPNRIDGMRPHRGSKKGKQKYKVMYQVVQKVIKVPATANNK